MAYATFRRTHDGRTYVPDDWDLDTLARALWGEEGSKPSQKALAATAWTWMNRYMLHPGQIRNWPKLEDLIKGHSQPVNPAWRRDGKFCRPGGKYHGTDHCSESRLKRRESCAFASWSSVPAACRSFALRFLSGEVPQVSDPPYVDFAAWTLTKNRGGVQVEPGGQGYLTKANDKSSSYWVPGTVEVSGGGGILDQKTTKYALGALGMIVVSSLTLLATSGR